MRQHMRLVSTTGDLASYYDDKSIAAPVAGMKETGFTHLDLSFYRVIYKGSPWISPGDGWKREVEDALTAAGSFGADFCQAHSPDGEHFKPGEERDALLLATRRSIQACAMVGVPHTVVHAGALPGATPTEFIKENIAFFKQFEEDAERWGVDLLVENSAMAWNPEYYLRTGKELREFVQLADMPRLHICWDVGHGNVQGCGQTQDIIDMGPELHALHVQDNYGDRDSHVMPLVGTTNFDNVLRGLIEIGYAGDFTFEAGCTLRRSGSWPHYRRDVTPQDLLAEPPRFLQQKQLSVMYELGKWMLGRYGITAE